MKILVTGGSGLVGKAIKQANTTVVTFGHTDMDIAKKDDVFRILNSIKPDCIVHCAALTDVDYCETHKEEAWKVNAEGTKNISQACEDIGAKLIYLSTDFVFDGKKGMYMEEDKPNPISIYAQAKLAGEDFTKNVDQHVIIRSSVVYGSSSKKFVWWVLNELSNNRKIKVVEDEYNSPTYVTDLARAILTITKADFAGIIHCAGSERISRYDFALKIAEIYGKDKNLIEKVNSEELKRTAKRPKDCSLNISKAVKMGIKMSDVNTGLELMKIEVA